MNSNPSLSFAEKISNIERLTSALEAARVGTWDLDIDQQLVWWDKRCQSLYGFSGADVVSYEQVLNLIHPEDCSMVREAIVWALNPESSGKYDVTFRTLGAKDGRLRWLHCRGQAFFDESGKASRFSGVAQDISRETDTRHQLETSEHHWRNIVSSSATATAIYRGRDMIIEAVNDAMLTIWGKDASVNGKTFSEALPELEDQPFLHLLQEVFDTGIAHHNSEGAATLMIDGRLQEFWFNYSYAPLRRESGEIYGIIHTATDITRQVQARRDLEVQKQQFQAMMEGSLLLKCLLDTKGTITFQNQRYQEYTGLTLEESRKDGWQRLFKAEHFEAFEKLVLRSFQTEKSFICESQLRRHDGTYCWHEIEFVPLFGENQKLTGWVCRATDIHEQKTLLSRLEYLVQQRTEELEASLEELRAANEALQERTEELAASNEELQALNEELEERGYELAASNEELQVSSEELGESNQQLSLSNDRLQRFAYVASHDLQEPLRKIQTFGSLLSHKYGSQLGNEGLSYLNRISKAGEQMSTLIQDLLNYSKMINQEDHFHVVSLNQVIEQVLETLDLSIEQTQAQIKIDPLPAIIGDESQLSQLFQNLISNAIKFAKPASSPHIHITTKIVHRPELPPVVVPITKADRYYQISVIDEGIGFDEQFLDRIFEVFQRLHDKKQYVGTGIGLAICQRVIENHGGAITAESAPGRGASFHVYFPV
ncbi:hypothetical protein BWI96_18990 [Siphonobacter sp. SORGH_AS_0500]|uniref:PAS domain-containing sensor histidine kinase n=1 Tax=Siphonobacter sp. SORGH_AS_0500 TaxID=1864824 RepID=UPI000CBB5052|nr:PAS domain S-box protein [Siphonobacter sp. SORGH_AS_0500]PKK35017.1 hypothetical protein BWI96_18990 [Siphonobacter sp. SORGH_AS_0500]